MTPDPQLREIAEAANAKGRDIARSAMATQSVDDIIDAIMQGIQAEKDLLIRLYDIFCVPVEAETE